MGLRLQKFTLNFWATCNQLSFNGYLGSVDNLAKLPDPLGPWQYIVALFLTFQHTPHFLKLWGQGTIMPSCCCPNFNNNANCRAWSGCTTTSIPNSLAITSLLEKYYTRYAGISKEWAWLSDCWISFEKTLVLENVICHGCLLPPDENVMTWMSQLPCGCHSLIWEVISPPKNVCPRATWPHMTT